jgi:hypothetical protein
MLDQDMPNLSNPLGRNELEKRNRDQAPSLPGLSWTFAAVVLWSPSFGVRHMNKGKITE